MWGYQQGHAAMTTAPDTSFKTDAPALSLLGFSAAHAKRARRWLANRSMASFYRPEDHSLNAFEFKQGREFTYDALRQAYEATQ